jgi:hypothetical protein
MSACVIPHLRAVFAKKCAFEKSECMLQGASRTAVGNSFIVKNRKRINKAS